MSAPAPIPSPSASEIESGLAKNPQLSELEETPTTSKSLGIIATYRSYSPEFSKSTEAKLLRRIDVRILPLIVIIYLFNYLDRNSITQARLYGLQEDTQVAGATYNTAISIFSAGYIAMQLPSTLLMAKLRPSRFLPGVIILWAVVSGCTGATSSPAGLLVVRFFLGIVEAPFFPGAIFYLSCWYTKRELGIRIALLVCGIPLSNAFAGLISTGILSGMAGVGHLAAWRWLFIIEGLATIVVGLAAMFLIPDYPATTKWLSEEERIVAQGRLAKDVGSEDVLGQETTTPWKGVIWAVKDIRVWIFAIMQMAITASLSYSHFFPTLIQGLGFKDNTTTLLLTSPPYLFAFFWSMTFAFDADRRQIRSPHAAISQITNIIGTVLTMAVPFKYQWPHYAFTFLVCAGTFGVYSTTYTWLSSTIPRPPIKRAAAIGIANSLANIASLFANYFWLDNYAPAFTQSWGCILAFQILGLCCILSLRLLLKRANKRFEKLAAETNLDDAGAMANLDDDATRAVLNGFRYVI